MTKEQELRCFVVASKVFDTAKELNAMYNALIAVASECENITGIPYDEFKAWLDNTLTKLNESWNKQYDALKEGKSKDEIRQIGFDIAKDTLKELFEDD